jgi:hypothetical protein
MGLLTFKSPPASVFWQQIDALFPTYGKWVDPQVDFAAWWSEAYKNLRERNDFTTSEADKRAFNLKEADKYSKTIVGNLQLRSKPGANLRDIAGALYNDMNRLKDVLPFVSLQTSRIRTVKGGDAFLDCSFTILKHVVSAVENNARRQSQDSGVNWQDPSQTVALLRFMDTSSQIKRWTGELPDTLRINANDQPPAYFIFLSTMMTADKVDDVSPVKLYDLQDNITKLASIDYALQNVLEQKKLVTAVVDATSLLQKLGSALVLTPPRDQDPNKYKMCLEAMSYVEALSGCPGFDQKSPGVQHRGSPSQDQEQKFKASGGAAVEQVEETVQSDLKGIRWEHDKK